MNEWKAPIAVKAGKPLDLGYGMALWDGAGDGAAVEKLYRRWLALSAAAAETSKPTSSR